ncbi:hypothetical protein B0J11DRAFT_501220 [Dendryphion nanum]|uniref:Uncharacterized protein n=1 Tax=Dendryphion nanum TaxID=256645 RepID=A0A9P9J2K2_9PLEO|nr:hypothetical protein B0J11DRAFT_501220 [Dendryphion nanum]
MIDVGKDTANGCLLGNSADNPYLRTEIVARVGVYVPEQIPRIKPFTPPSQAQRGRRELGTYISIWTRLGNANFGRDFENDVAARNNSLGAASAIGWLATSSSFQVQTSEDGQNGNRWQFVRTCPVFPPAHHLPGNGSGVSALPGLWHWIQRGLHSAPPLKMPLLLQLIAKLCARPVRDNWFRQADSARSRRPFATAATAATIAGQLVLSGSKTCARMLT